MGSIALFQQFPESVGLENPVLGIHPHDLRAALHSQLPALLQGHQEQRRGKAVGKAGVRAEDADAAPEFRGHPCGGVDDVVVSHAVHGVVALIVAAGDQTGALKTHRAEVGIGVFRGLDANDPFAAIRLAAKGADVAAQVQKISLG